MQRGLILYILDSKTLFGTADDNNDFSLPSSTRSSLSSILIVHPIAALLTLICFILSAVAHLHAPSHSPRYLLAVLILSIPTLLITLLAFLVDILLFVPHLAWGGWIVLISTVLILASGIVTCAMRRTLVSRKARKKRIAENSEMNGANFYARQTEPTGPRAETPPPLITGGFGQADKLPQFATFERKSAEEDEVPLNQQNISNRTPPSAPSSGAPAYAENQYTRYDSPRRGGHGGRGGMRGGARGGYGGTPRDEYGNPMPPSNAFGPMPPAGIRRDRSEPARIRPQYSDETTCSGNPRSRGRGGYSRGYARGGPYGQGNGNGYGYGRGAPPMGMHARRGPPPPEYGNAYGPPGRPGQYESAGGPAGFGRSPSAPAYGSRGPPSRGPPAMASEYRLGPSPQSNPGGYQRGPSPGPPSDRGLYNQGPSSVPTSAQNDFVYERPNPMPGQFPRTYTDESQRVPARSDRPENRPAIGQAVEMDALNGCPSPAPGSVHQTVPPDGDTNLQGSVGLPQQANHRDSPMSLTSAYSAQE